MLFLATIDWYEGKVIEALKRRPGWTPPEGAKILGEYWSIGTGRAIIIAEAPDAITAALTTLPWEDIGHITVAPALTLEEGLKMLKLWKQ
jgi:hypothetical protein